MAIYEGSRYSNTEIYVDINRNYTKTLSLRDRFNINLTGSFTYTVVQGDTIDSIAYKVYGNAQLWWAILDVNTQYMSELDISAGDILVIPAYSEVVKVIG